MTFVPLAIKKPTIIGMIHLPPLIGYPGYMGLQKTIDFARRELEALQKGGITAAMVENENDQPHQIEVGPETIDCMTAIMYGLLPESSVPLGVQVMLNDPKASLKVAKSSGGCFIRTDYFVDRMAREEYGGEMKIDPLGWLEYRKKIQAEDILILTDVQVKYATLLEKGKTISQSVLQAIAKGSDGIIVTGNFTGQEPNIDHLIEAKQTAGDFPVLVGSGFDVTNANRFLEYSDGAIVGTSLKADGRIDEGKVSQLMYEVVPMPR